MIEWIRRVFFRVPEESRARVSEATEQASEPATEMITSAPSVASSRGVEAEVRRAILAGTAGAGLRVRRVKLSGEQQLFELPPGLQCSSLDLSKSAVRELPDDLQVEFRLDLSDCAELTTLPRGLKTGSLFLSRCTKLRALPEALDVNFLTVDGCTALVTWPESARVSHGSVSARGCANLEGLPRALTQLANLDLSGCRKISSLPDTLELSGWLDVADTALTSLPESLRGVPLRWRGVRIDAQIAFFPETLTATQILTERNAEVRRVMIERLGVERFLQDAQAEVLDEDRDAGGQRQLLRVPLPEDEPLVCVSVRCPSTARHYLIRVPPTMRRCHDAVAWTAGFDDPADYRPVVET